MQEASSKSKKLVRKRDIRTITTHVDFVVGNMKNTKTGKAFNNIKLYGTIEQVGREGETTEFFEFKKSLGNVPCKSQLRSCKDVKFEKFPSTLGTGEDKVL